MKKAIAYRFAENIDDVCEGSLALAFADRRIRVCDDGYVHVVDAEGNPTVPPMACTFSVLERLGGVLAPVEDSPYMGFDAAVALATSLSLDQWRVVSALQVFAAGSMANEIATFRLINDAVCLRMAELNAIVPDCVIVQAACETLTGPPAHFALAPIASGPAPDPFEQLCDGLSREALESFDIQDMGLYAEDCDANDRSVDQIATLYDKRGRPAGTLHVGYPRYDGLTRFDVIVRGGAHETGARGFVFHNGTVTTPTSLKADALEKAQRLHSGQVLPL